MKKLIVVLIALVAFSIAPNTTHADSTPDLAVTLKAAKQGNANGQYNLGLRYSLGEGIAKDMVLAYAWLNLAAINSDADAVKMRDMVERNLDPAGRNEGQRLASNWEIGQSIKREK